GVAASALGVARVLGAGVSVVARERESTAGAVHALVVRRANITIITGGPGRLGRRPATRLLVADRIQTLIAGRADQRGSRMAGLLAVAHVVVVAVAVAVRAVAPRNGMIDRRVLAGIVRRIAGIARARVVVVAVGRGLGGAVAARADLRPVAEHSVGARRTV